MLSGGAPDAFGSNGKVTHNGCPGRCASWQAISSPPRDTLIVSHRSVCWPSGADHLSLAGSRSRTRGCKRCCMIIAHLESAGGFAQYILLLRKPARAGTSAVLLVLKRLINGRGKN